MNVRRRPSLTMLIADGVAVVALVASIAVLVIRLSGPGDAAPVREPAARADAPRPSEPSGGAEATPESRPPPRSDDCRRKGITRTGGEGTCYRENGRRVHVVDRRTPLRLAELDASVLSFEQTPRPVENAIDVKVRLRIRSKVDGQVDLAPERFGLHLADQLIPADPVLNSFEKESLVSSGIRLRRGEEATGVVIFRIPAGERRHLNRTGGVWIAQFSDISPTSAGRTVGVFRTYR